MRTILGIIVGIPGVLFFIALACVKPDPRMPKPKPPPKYHFFPGF